MNIFQTIELLLVTVAFEDMVSGHLMLHIDVSADFNCTNFLSLLLTTRMCIVKVTITTSKCVLILFLVADMQLDKRLCLYAPGSDHRVKSRKMSVLDTFCACLSVGVGWGVDGGWMPLPTRLQRYCDPASLV